MSISVYSVFTAFLWFNLFIAILCLLRKTLKIFGYHLFPLILASVLTLARLIFPWEPPFALVLPSDQVFPAILRVLKVEFVSTDFIRITVWMAIITVLALVAIVRFIYVLVLFFKKLKRLHSLPQANDPRVLLIFQKVMKKCSVKRKCYLYILNSDFEPYTFGFFYSIIILPEKFLSLSDQDLSNVLDHEWQHHVSNDGATKLFIEFLCCVMWWNPFIHLLRQNLNQAIELKCDAKVTKSFSQKRKKEYTRSIKRVLELCIKEDFCRSKSYCPVSLPLLGIAFKGKNSTNNFNIIQRVDAILNFNKDRKKHISLACAIFVVLLFIGSFSFVIQPFFLPPNEFLIPEQSSDKFYQVTSETSLLVDMQNGSYSLLVNGKHLHDVQTKALKHQPYHSLPIITTK